MEMRVVRDVGRPAEQVFAFLSDVSNNPQWQNGMKACEWTSEGPIAIGSTYEQHARFMGTDVRSAFVVTEYEPGSRIVIQTVKSTFPIEVERRVEATREGSCRVSAVISGGPEGRIARLLQPVLTRMAQRSVDRDYDRLVDLLESDS